MSRGADQSDDRGRPNVVLVMADDMGFSDVGCYGGEIDTSTLDRLAENGTRFTQFYNHARCCPTRASLLTGTYPHKVGMGWMTAADLGPDGYAGDLSDRCATIAEVLGDAGYATYMSGKWHLTRNEFVGPDASQHNWPRQRGFDRFYGTLAGAGSYYTPDSLVRDNEWIEPPEDYYHTDAINDAAADFVRDHGASDDASPFFLYVAHTAPHWPLHAREEDVAKYDGAYDEGWDPVRERRYEALIKEGIVDDDWELSPSDGASWDDLDPEKQAELSRKMAIYAAQVDVMDRGIGRVVAALEETGQFENTLFLFLSDNGGSAEGGPFGFDRRSDDPDRVLGEDSSFSSYGRSWANASNTPFRLYKSWAHEGGIATPLIAHWPAGLEAGDLVREPGHVVDVMATCVELAETTYPRTRGGEELVPLDGESLLPLLRGESRDRGPIFWEHEANRAVRDGDWKLVETNERDEWELYDLSVDRTECHDLADEHPARVARLAERWEDHAERANVLPLDGRGWDERVS